MGIVSRLKWRLKSLFKPSHPIDRLYNIDTSQAATSSAHTFGIPFLDAENAGYVGSQPSVIRAALAKIPDLDRYSFLDLGCGKGRALAVASEYPFRIIRGIELSALLCRIAEANAAAIMQRNAQASIEIVQGDATAPDLTSLGPVVIFLYNSFKGQLTLRLTQFLDEVLNKNPDLPIFLIYYNPVHFEMFDRMDCMVRYFADRYDFEPEEIKATPFINKSDSVVCYKSSNIALRPLPGHDRKVLVTVPDFGADVQTSATGN